MLKSMITSDFKVGGWLFYNWRFLLLSIGLGLSTLLAAQTTPNIQSVSIAKDSNYNGFDLLDLEDHQVFVLAEHWHNIRSVPRATMKLLKYLHRDADGRLLAIEQGSSVATMINNFLASGDTVVLRQIVRNTMFWGKENHAFLLDLYAFNQSLSETDRIVVQSVDIEYKLESAIFVINQLIAGKQVPENLSATVGAFQQLFEDTRSHREQFDGLSVMYYYDREFVNELVKYTRLDIEDNRTIYQDFFGQDFNQFKTLITDMFNGLIFDYTNPNTNYKFRDRLIQTKFLDLLEASPEKGILCVIGMRHATKGSSIYKLDTQERSPVTGKVLKIKVSALFKNTFKTSDLRRVNFTYPKQLKVQQATLIKHIPGDATLRSAKSFDYTLFINDNGSLTPFENVLKEGY